jgi:hypothetical protein
MNIPVKIFVGYDSRYPHVYETCVASIKRHTNTPIEPLNLSLLKQRGYYWGSEKGSTEFTLTRFLAPFLKGYYGYAIFCDSDFIWTKDPTTVLDEIEENKAINVVKHNIRVQDLSTIKMNGQPQVWYERKNWSSFIVFNCEHPFCKTLTPEFVSTADWETLLTLDWAGESIGGISYEYNFLVGYYEPTMLPYGIHYTDGGPWLPDYEQCEFCELWKEVYVNDVQRRT